MNYAKRANESEPVRLLREYEGRYPGIDHGDGTGAQADAEQEEILRNYRTLIAASRGDVDLLRMLLNDGIDVNLYDYDKRTPLMVAASEGHEDVVKVLLEYGANVRSRDRWGSTAFSEAERFGHHGIMMLIRSAENQAGATYGSMSHW